MQLTLRSTTRERVDRVVLEVWERGVAEPT
jgi:hypothetical protein